MNKVESKYVNPDRTIKTLKKQLKELRDSLRGAYKELNLADNCNRALKKDAYGAHVAYISGGTRNTIAAFEKNDEGMKVKPGDIVTATGEIHAVNNSRDKSERTVTFILNTFYARKR